MARRAAGFNTQGVQQRSNSRTQKKAVEAKNPGTVLGSPRNVINPPRQPSGEIALVSSSWGRPANATECTQATNSDTTEVAA